jgi:hypothetical protein
MPKAYIPAMADASFYAANSVRLPQDVTMSLAA